MANFYRLLSLMLIGSGLMAAVSPTGCDTRILYEALPAAAKPNREVEPLLRAILLPDHVSGSAITQYEMEQGVRHLRWIMEKLASWGARGLWSRYLLQWYQAFMDSIQGWSLSLAKLTELFYAPVLVTP